jgi:hypothetical protein
VGKAGGLGDLPQRIARFNRSSDGVVLTGASPDRRRTLDVRIPDDSEHEPGILNPISHRPTDEKPIVDLVTVPHLWHTHGMSRVRVSTTVDSDLLTEARTLHRGTTDAALLDEALGALVARHRAAEVDAAYANAYDAHPLDEPDEWGDLASFRSAAGAT